MWELEDIHNLFKTNERDPSTKRRKGPRKNLKMCVDCCNVKRGNYDDEVADQDMVDCSAKLTDVICALNDVTDVPKELYRGAYVHSVVKLQQSESGNQSVSISIETKPIETYTTCFSDTYDRKHQLSRIYEQYLEGIEFGKKTLHDLEQMCIDEMYKKCNL